MTKKEAIKVLEVEKETAELDIKEGRSSKKLRDFIEAANISIKALNKPEVNTRNEYIKVLTEIEDQEYPYTNERGDKCNQDIILTSKQSEVVKKVLRSQLKLHQFDTEVITMIFKTVSWGIIFTLVSIMAVYATYALAFGIALISEKFAIGSLYEYIDRYLIQITSILFCTTTLVPFITLMIKIMKANKSGKDTDG